MQNIIFYSSRLYNICSLYAVARTYNYVVRLSDALCRCIHGNAHSWLTQIQTATRWYPTAIFYVIIRKPQTVALSPIEVTSSILFLALKSLLFLLL